MKKLNPHIAESIRKQLGEMIRQRRKELGYRQLDVATEAGIRLQTVTAVEQGKECEISTMIGILTVLRYSVVFQDKDKYIYPVVIPLHIPQRGGSVCECKNRPGETKLWCCNHCGNRCEDF